MSQSTATNDYSGGWVPGDKWGTRLAIVRQIMGWNVSQAADECGTTHQSWANWEEGKKCRDQEAMALKIAEATGCSFVWLATGQVPPGVETRSRCSDATPALTVIEGQKYPQQRTRTHDGPRHLHSVN